MRKIVTTMLTLAFLAMTTLLPFATAEAGVGSATVCRRGDATLTGARCWEAQAQADGSSQTTCEPKSGSPGVYVCTSRVSLSLAVTGATPTCGWAWSAPTGEILACNYLLLIPQKAAAVGTYVFETTQLVGTRTIVAEACIDYGTPIQDCERFDVTVNFAITASSTVPPLAGLLGDAAGVVDAHLAAEPVGTNVV